MQTTQDALANWLTLALPKTGAVEATYSATGGVGFYYVGVNFATHQWYWYDSKNLMLESDHQTLVYWAKGAPETTRMDAGPGSDCSVATPIPVLALADIASRPQVLQSSEVLPDGTLSLTARFETGTRCAGPAGSNPADWTFSLSPQGRVTKMVISKDGAKEQYDYTYSDKSPASVGLAELTHDGKFALTSAKWYPVAPSDFASLDRLKAKVGEAGVTYQQAFQSQSVPATPQTPSQSQPSTPAPDPYNPLAGYSAPLIVTGIVAIIVGLVVLWRRSK